MDALEIGENQVLLAGEMAVEGGEGHARLLDDPGDADGVDALGVKMRAAVSSRRSRAAEFFAGERSVIRIAVSIIEDRENARS